MSLVSPLVSVVIPCYNRAHLVGRAIDSVLCQSFPDWEVVVVDDGSCDGLAAALRSYVEVPRVRLVCHARNLGEPTARNTGISAAFGRFVAFLDSDDEWRPRKLERQIAAVMAMPDPDRVFCVTQTLVLLSDRSQVVRPLRRPIPGRSFAEFLYNDGGFAQSSSFLLATSLAKRFPFRPHLTQMVDHLFFIEVGASGADYVLVPEPLTVWHNEAGPDRVSLSDTQEKWLTTMQCFREQAAGLLPPHVLAACEARFMSGILWRTAPLESLKLLWRAQRTGALSTSQVATLFCRNALPQSAYNAARHWLAALQRTRIRLGAA
jgi:hypothetical protein